MGEDNLISLHYFTSVLKDSSIAPERRLSSRHFPLELLYVALTSGTPTLAVFLTKATRVIRSGYDTGAPEFRG